MLIPLLILIFSCTAVYGSLLFGFAHLKPPPNSGNMTVIVLGCEIIDDQPSLMLARRLNGAYNYLIKNPDSKCIVSGGLSNNKKYSEAQVMKTYLVAQGIKADRIFLENRSANTSQNLKFAYKVAVANNLSLNAIISTDAFHQLRSQLYAKRYGFTSGFAIPSNTPWGLVPGYSIREFFAIIQAAIFTD
ncbi:MAG: YdcF family protein [Oscillospiraceae bacterium]